MSFPLDISLHRVPWGWGAQSVNSLKILMDTKPKQKSYSQKCLHPETDSNKTLFPEFIVLKSTEDTPLTKLSPFIIEKTLSSMVKPKSVKKLVKNTLLVEVIKKTYSDLLLEQILLKSYNKNLPPQPPEFVIGHSEKSIYLPLHHR